MGMQYMQCIGAPHGGGRQYKSLKIVFKKAFKIIELL